MSSYERMAAAATAAGVPPRRSGRAGVAASTAAADATRASERVPLPTDLGGDRKVDGASINFLASVSMVPLSTFVETFAKFAQISLKKKGRGVSEGPRREKNSEKSQNTTPF